MNTNFMNGMFGKLKPGMARMSMQGAIAIKTSNGYKTYDVNSGTLVNCDDFVFDIGEEFFFLIPTNNVQRGDIILVSGKPCCVIKEEGNTIQVLSYEDSSIKTVVPENHMFMGKTYFYGKIVSMFGTMGADGDTSSMMKYMMLSQMMGSSSNNTNNNQIIPMMMLMNGGFDKMFGNIFNASDTKSNTCACCKCETEVKENN